MPTPKTTLFLRGMPRAVVRGAKAEAARRGEPLGSVVSDALVRMLGGDSADENVLAEDMAWYQSNRERLLRRFAGEYVAVVARRVVDHDRHFDRLAQRVFARHGVRPIFMPRVSREDRVHRLRSPRLDRS